MKQIGLGVSMYGSDYSERFPYCRSWGKAWGDDHRLGTEYLPQLLEPLIGKNPGTNRPAGSTSKATPPTSSTYICPAGIKGKDPLVAGFQNLLRDNEYVTYVWNHIYLKKDNATYEEKRPSAGVRPRMSLILHQQSCCGRCLTGHRQPLPTILA